MAKGNKNPSKATRFKPGNNANPKGRPALPEEIRELRSYQKTEIEAVFTKFLEMDITQIKAFLKNDGTPKKALHVVIARLIEKAMENGSIPHFDFLLSHIIGKQQENFNIQGNYHVGVVDLIERLKEARKPKGE